MKYDHTTGKYLFKYEFSGEEKKFNNATIRRIRALKDFGEVKKGDVGGWIGGENNLSHYQNCWVHDDAIVVGSAKVSSNVQIRHSATVHGYATVSGTVEVCNESEVSGRVFIMDNARVLKKSKVFGNARVQGNAILDGDEVHVYGSSSISGNARVCDNAKVLGTASIGEDSILMDNVLVLGNSKVKGTVKVHSNAVINSDILLSGRVDVSGSILNRKFSITDDCVQISRAPTVINYGIFTIVITDLHITIDSLTYLTEQWKGMDSKEVLEAGEKILETLSSGDFVDFWTSAKSSILGVAAVHQK